MSTAPTALVRREDLPLVAGAMAAAVAAGAAAALGGPAVVLAAVLAAAFLAVAVRPAAGVLLYVALVPFVAGIERGAVVPLVRPQEALQLFLTLAVVAGCVVRYARGESAHLHLSRMDGALVVMAVAGSVWPVASALLRGVDLTGQDLAAAGQLWRFAALYALVRVALRTEGDVRTCLWLLVLGAVVLSLIALLQSLGRFGVEDLLARWYATGEAATFEGRGSATLGNPIAVGDAVAAALAVVVVWYQRRPELRRVLVPLGLVLLAGLVGTGQFSAWIAGAVVVVALVVREPGSKRQVVRALPLGAVAVAVGWPVLARRFVELLGGDLPVSWVVRWDNLQTFYLPHLAGWGAVLGVRPDTVIPAPETWREQIFLESGYLALLWVGGIPLLLAFVGFVVAALRRTNRIGASRVDDVGTAAAAAWALLCSLVLLTVFDIHLTLRGGGDLLFVLLGVAANRVVRPAGAEAVP